MQKLLAGVFAIALLSGETKPDFSGTWKLLSRNDVAAKDSLIHIVKQKGDDLHYRIDRDQNERVTDVDLTIGGPPHVSDEYGIIQAKWQDDVLVVSFLYNPGTEREAEQVEHWKLAEAGKRILDDTVVRRAQGKEAHIQRVFERQ